MVRPHASAARPAPDRTRTPDRSAGSGRPPRALASRHHRGHGGVGERPRARARAPRGLGRGLRAASGESRGLRAQSAGLGPASPAHRRALVRDTALGGRAGAPRGLCVSGSAHRARRDGRPAGTSARAVDRHRAPRARLDRQRLHGPALAPPVEPAGAPGSGPVFDPSTAACSGRRGFAGLRPPAGDGPHCAHHPRSDRSGGERLRPQRPRRRRTRRPPLRRRPRPRPPCRLSPPRARAPVSTRTPAPKRSRSRRPPRRPARIWRERRGGRLRQRSHAASGRKAARRALAAALPPGRGRAGRGHLRPARCLTRRRQARVVGAAASCRHAHAADRGWRRNRWLVGQQQRRALRTASPSPPHPVRPPR